MPKKMMMLCRPCADKLSVNATVRAVRRGVDMKITCQMCGRRRYGAEYEVGKSPTRCQRQMQRGDFEEAARAAEPEGRAASNVATVGKKLGGNDHGRE